MRAYHCSLYEITEPKPPRVVLYEHNGVKRVGTQRPLTKDEKKMLKPARARRQRVAREADLTEYF